MAKIIVVDDDLAIRTLLKINLEMQGHQVLMATDGLEGYAPRTGATWDEVRAPLAALKDARTGLMAEAVIWPLASRRCNRCARPLPGDIVPRERDTDRMQITGRSFARRLDVISLQLFVSVCELGSIGRAAERGHIKPGYMMAMGINFMVLCKGELQHRKLWNLDEPTDKDIETSVANAVNMFLAAYGTEPL